MLYSLSYTTASLPMMLRPKAQAQSLEIPFLFKSRYKVVFADARCSVRLNLPSWLLFLPFDRSGGLLQFSRLRAFLNTTEALTDDRRCEQMSLKNSDPENSGLKPQTSDLRSRKLRPRKLRPRKPRPRKLRPRKLRPRKLKPGLLISDASISISIRSLCAVVRTAAI